MMDKLLYYVHQADEFLPKYLALADEAGKKFLTDEVKELLKTTEMLEDEDSSDEDEEGNCDQTQANRGELSDDEDDYTPTSKWSGNSLTHKVMRSYVKRRRALVHHYSHVGHLCSPNPVIMEDARRSYTANPIPYRDAVEALVKKLIVGREVVGRKRKEQTAKSMEEFWTSLNHFQNRTGPYGRDMIWISADNEDLEAHRWHQNYSISDGTACFGKLACLTTSKVGGSGTCERNWKQVKQAKTGKRNKTEMEKVGKQVVIYGRHQNLKAEARGRTLAQVQKLWSEKDFASLKLNSLCLELGVETQMESEKVNRIFRAWEETWEKKKIGSTGDKVQEARLLRKYGGLKWKNPDKNVVFTGRTEKMIFEKKRGNNQYHVFGVADGFDLDVEKEKQPGLWDWWPRVDDFYDMVTDYYKDSDTVTCFQEYDDCSSEEED